MTTTLSSLTTRVAQILYDSSSARFPTVLIEEAIRTALGEYNLPRAVHQLTPQTISGLDGAAETTLPPQWESLIASGAAGLAASSRQLQRAEAYDLGNTVPAELQSWAESRLAWFRTQLALIERQYELERQRDLLGASQPPWASDPWQLDDWEEPR